MAQNVVDFSGNPSGSGLMDDYLDKDQQNVLTSNSGIQRPTYAVAGTIWIDTSVTPWLWKMYDGTNDITLGNIDPSTHLFMPYLPLMTTGDLVTKGTDGNLSNLSAGEIGTILTSNGPDKIPSYQKFIDDNLVHKTGDETIEGVKTFTDTITRTGVFGSTALRATYCTDTNNKGIISNEAYYTNNVVYNRSYCYNGTSSTTAYVDLAINDDGYPSFQVSSNIDKNIDGADKSRKLATTRWVWDNMASQHIGNLFSFPINNDNNRFCIVYGTGVATSSGEQINFGTSFPNKCWGVVMAQRSGSNVNQRNDMWYTDLTLSGFKAYKANYNVNIFYVAFGY